MSKSMESSEKSRIPTPAKLGSADHAFSSAGKLQSVSKPSSVREQSKDINNNLATASTSGSRSVSPTTRPASPKSVCFTIKTVNSLANESDSTGSVFSSASSALTAIEANRTDRTYSADESKARGANSEATESKTLVYNEDDEQSCYDEDFDSDSSESFHHYSLIDMTQKKRKSNKTAADDDGTLPEECQIITEPGDDGRSNSSADDTYLALVYPSLKSVEPVGRPSSPRPNRSNERVPAGQILLPKPIVFFYSPSTCSNPNQSGQYYDELEEQDAKNKKHLANIDYICQSRECVNEYKHQWIIENLNTDFYEVGEQIEGNSFPDKANETSDGRDKGILLGSSDDGTAFTFRLYPSFPPSKDATKLEKPIKFALTICFGAGKDKQRLLSQLGQNHKLVFKVGFKILDENKELLYTQSMRTFAINLSKEDEIPIKQFENEIARILFKHFYAADPDEALWYLSDPDPRERSRDLYFVFETVFLRETTESAVEKPSKGAESLRVQSSLQQQSSIAEDSQSLSNAKMTLHGTRRSFEPGQFNAEVTEIRAIKFLWHIENYPSLLLDLLRPSTKPSAKTPPWIESSQVNWKKKKSDTPTGSSQSFGEEISSEHKWALNLYPKGKDERYSGHMSLFIKHLQGPEVKVVAEFILLSPQGKEISIMRLPPQALPSGKRWGVGEYFQLTNLEDLRPSPVYDDMYSVNPMTKPSGSSSLKSKPENSVRFNLVCRLKIVNRRTVVEANDASQQRISSLFGPTGSNESRPEPFEKSAGKGTDADRQSRNQQARIKTLYERFYKTSKHCDMIVRLKLTAADSQRLLNGELDGIVDVKNGMEELRQSLRKNAQSPPVFVDFLVHKLILSLNSILFDEHIREFNDKSKRPQPGAERVMQLQNLEIALPPAFMEHSPQKSFPAIVVTTSFSALNKFIKYLYTQQLDLSDPSIRHKSKCVSPICVRVTSPSQTTTDLAFRNTGADQQKHQEEIYRLNMLFELYELALRYEVIELLDEIEERARELIKLNYVVCWLDRLADLMAKIKEEQVAFQDGSKTTPSDPPISKVYTSYALLDSKLVYFRRFKGIVMRFFIKNLNTILKTRKDFLNVEFKLNDRRQLIYDEIWKFTSASK